MRNVILFDDDVRDELLPLTLSRPVSEIRLGILNVREKWEHVLKAKASWITIDYLSNKFPIQIEDDNLIINGSVLPNDRLLRLVNQLEFNEALLLNGELIAARLQHDQFQLLASDDFIEEITGYEIKGTPLIRIQHVWDIFRFNRTAIEYDFQILTAGAQSQPISATNQVLAKDNIFVEEGAVVECCILNAQSGPIYIGKDAVVMEGSILRGPVSVGNSAIVKMGAKIYGPTTIGPSSKVGGEVKGSVIMGYSNKTHEGYMGDSVIGQFCNIGADTNISNLKNNYSEIKLWNYREESFVKTGLTFCGLIMGDHSKTGINTMINTGTVIGFSCNVFGAGYPRKFIPSFSWGGASGFRMYDVKKAIETAEIVTARKKLNFTEVDKDIFEAIAQFTDQYRHY